MEKETLLQAFERMALPLVAFVVFAAVLFVLLDRGDRKTMRDFYNHFNTND